VCVWVGEGGEEICGGVRGGGEELLYRRTREGSVSLLDEGGGGEGVCVEENSGTVNEEYE